MKKYLIFVTAMIFSLSCFGQNVAPKTNLVISDGGYSNFGVYQRLSTIPEYVLCDMSECPSRTTKTIVNSIEEKNIVESPSILNSQIKIYFAFGSSHLSHESEQKLFQILENLKSAKRISLRGWTDPIGGKASIKNTELAKARVDSIQAFLLSNGVTVPINSNFEPPCCTNLKATKNSPEKIRKLMRFVEINY